MYLFIYLYTYTRELIFECFSILNFETRYKVGNIDRIQHVDCDCKNLSTAYRFFYGHVTLARPSCGKRGERVRERDSEGERERQTASHITRIQILCCQNKLR